MRFDIEGFVTFDTEEASLVNLLTGDCIELSATSTRLLTSLLQCRGDIISRIDIFQIVFEKYGATPSNSNLNQYISTLRRSLANLGIEKNVIITVPRIGFKISDEIIVTTDSDYHSAFPLPTITPEPAKCFFILRHPKLSVFCLLFSAFILLLIYLAPYKNPLNNKIIIHDKCSIYVPETISTAEIVNKIDNKNLLPFAIDCSTPNKIYFFEKNINNDPDFGIYMNTFILKCDIKNKKCLSYYYKEIKNA